MYFNFNYLNPGPILSRRKIAGPERDPDRGQDKGLEGPRKGSRRESRLREGCFVR